MGHLYYDFLKRNCDYNQSSKIEVDTLKVYIVGVDTGSPSGLLASPYMEKELNVLGYQVEQFPAKDADSLMQALMQCAQPDALILCPLSGNLPADAALYCCKSE